MPIPKEPISKEARDYLVRQLPRMKGKEREKTVKRLEMFDRGFRKKKEEDFRPE